MAGVSGAPIPHGSHPYLSGPLPTTSVSILPSSADTATVVGKASPPARTKPNDRTPKCFAKKSHDTRLTHEASHDAGETAARTVAHIETPRRVSNDKPERRDIVDVNGVQSSHKRCADQLPDSGARKRRMRSDNTNTLPVRSSVGGEISPIVNGSDARKEKRAEKIESGRELQTSPQTSLPRPDRKSRTSATNSRSGYKTPPASGR